jgi:hypothetical protein
MSGSKRTMDRAGLGMGDNFVAETINGRTDATGLRIEDMNSSKSIPTGYRSLLSPRKSECSLVTIASIRQSCPIRFRDLVIRLLHNR